MTFEGQTKVLPIKGIERAGADNLCEDGAMNEVVGLEYKEGSYVPYAGGGVTRASLNSFISGHNGETIKSIMIHKTSAGTNIILISDKVVNDAHEQYVYWTTETNFNATTGHTWNRFSGISNVSDVEFVGNVICISTSEKIKYYIYKENSYTIVENNLGNCIIKARLVKSVYDTDNEMYNNCIAVGITKSLINSTTNPINEDELFESCLIKALGNAKAAGGIIGYVLFSYGWRLKNGDIIKASNPILLCYPDINYGEYGIKKTDGTLSSLIYEVNGVRHLKATFLRDDQSYLSDISTWNYIKIYSELIRTYRSVVLTFTTENVKFSPRLFTTLKVIGYSYRFMAGALMNSLQIKVDGTLPSNSEIKSLCLFISDEIYPYYDINSKYTEEALEEINLEGTENDIRYYSKYPKLKSLDKIRDEVEKKKTMYLCKEINVSKLSNYSEWKYIDLKGILGDVLLTMESYNPSSSIEYLYGNPKLNTYNYRLNAFDFNQKTNNLILRDMYFVPNQQYLYVLDDFNCELGDGQVWSGYHTEDPTAIFTGKWEIDIHCKYENGTPYTNVLSGTYESTDYIPIIVNPYVSCIDKNAYEIVFRLIVYNHNGTLLTQTKYYTKTISLSKNTNLGIVENISSLTPVELTEITDPTQIPENLPVETESNIGETWHNKLIVSDVAYPSYFPKDKTYTIGNGTILKLARLSTALSQDSFGRYPLLAFCTDGIYSLNVDTDGGAYTNITPFSREVCVNPNTICEIDGAVIFASDKGLMVATEKGVDFFNLVLNGEPKHLPMDDKSKGNGLYYYGKIISTKGATQLWDNPTRNSSGAITAYNDKAISRQDFINYLKDEDAVTGEKLTCISYVSMKNKLIVYNRTKEFIYWIDIPTRNTTKLYTHISTDNGNYPTEKYYSLGENENKEITFDYLSENVDTDTMFQTRPIKIAKGLKGTFRVVLRGYFRNDETYAVNSEDKKYYAELFVLGSLDGTNWQVIGKKEKCLYGGFHDFGCETDRVSYNYLMICFSGRLQPDKEVNGMSDDTEGSHIDSIEITLESRDDNKR